MSLKTFVKISQITNLSDARYCAGMMVDVLGFNLEEGSEGYVSPETFNEITNWVAGVKFAGEFTQAQVAEVKLAATNYPLDYIQVQQADQLEELQETGTDLIYKLVIQSADDVAGITSQLAFAADLAKMIIIQSLDPSLDEAIYAELIKSELDIPLIKGYSLSEATAPAVADDKVFTGIELEGSPEERPGFKDYGTVMDILEVLEEE
ncbi:phosphoribosylanthranilate isomerase [Marinoscillum furvescens]|uniref:phosphoribosylanthranilate isomerase n=1 Tax=Marinoscillum furvescens DSM 4134 TaxID=1122208 RepID=A0A3D9KYP5_MARFU|nr:hypothetical protein [Marinoscillum furvescens]RED94923.1 phosphoribosylanthranilate isomerase [Marinoscillum furvescens DSM 4134]